MEFRDFGSDWRIPRTLSLLLRISRRSRVLEAAGQRVPQAAGSAISLIPSNSQPDDLRAVRVTETTARHEIRDLRADCDSARSATGDEKPDANYDRPDRNGGGRRSRRG